MNRREFISRTTAAFFTTLFAGSLAAPRTAIPDEIDDWHPLNPLGKDGPAPLPEITAAVNVIVPADPEIPGDFVGSDYDGDWVLASTLGELGQMMAKVMLDQFARQVAGKSFMDCTNEERMAAIKQWIREREDLSPTLNELLSGILTISMIGTYEDNDPEAELELFESMGWYDPQDVAGTFHIPCEGYPDARLFPVRLKKGLQK